ILPLAFIATDITLVDHPSAIDQSFKRSHAEIIFAPARSAGHLKKKHLPLL
ncbi:19792_t:CDS:1, partial [Rhizophagus irregularis]